MSCFKAVDLAKSVDMMHLDTRTTKNTFFLKIYEYNEDNKLKSELNLRDI
jgi:hypothetical protein